MELRWLHVSQRVKYKVLLYVFKALHKQTPSYIANLIQVHSPCLVQVRLLLLLWQGHQLKHSHHVLMMLITAKLLLSTKDAKYRKEATVTAAKRVYGKTEQAVKDGLWSTLVHVASDKDTVEYVDKTPRIKKATSKIGIGKRICYGESTFCIKVGFKTKISVSLCDNKSKMCAVQVIS